MTLKEMLKALARNPFAVGVATLGVLLLMAWTVSVRIGDADMPMRDVPGLGSFVLPGDMAGDGLPVLSQTMPEFRDIEAWLNSEPLTAASLRGKVVLVDFWTYSCINCVRTLPYVTAWQKTYGGESFTVIGVHTPEFAFEKDEGNVRKAIARHGITYPVALDNSYGTWNNYSNRYWPAHYLFDAKGRLRFTHFGEGKYDITENNIRALIEEAGMDAGETMAGEGVEAVTPDFRRIGTHETYLGYGRMAYLGSKERVLRDQPQTYTEPEGLRTNTFAFVGEWRVEDERAVSTSSGAGITYPYDAATASLVMGTSTGATVRAEVTLGGAPVPAELRGADVYEEGGKTYVDVGGQRLYDLIDARGEYGKRTLRLRFEAPGVETYAFTFG